MASDSSFSNARKVGIPKSLEYILRRDMQQFEFLKKRDKSLAVNQFINALMIGYYDEYKVLLSGHENRLKELLSPYIASTKKLESVVRQIMMANKPDDDETRKTDGKVLRFRPTDMEAISIDSEIFSSVNKLDMSLAGFYRNMFLSYSRKPVYEREKIIFHDTAKVLEEACKKRTALRFSYRDNPGNIKTVIPYKLVYGSDEQFNYLLCQETSPNGKKLMAASYRLRRIVRPKIKDSKEKLDAKVKEFLDQMIRYDPRYSINEDQESCVEFTEKGRESFDMIYTGRPIPDEKGTPDEAGNSRYLFRCSREQLTKYLLNFNPGEFKVIYPDKLKTSLMKFHQKHLDCLKE